MRQRLQRLRHIKRRQTLIGTAAYAVVWLLVVVAWLCHADPPWWLTLIEWFVFTLAFPLAAAWIVWTRWPVRRDTIVVSAVSSIAFVVVWQGTVFVAEAFVWDVLKTWLARVGTGGLFLIGLAWMVWIIEQASQYYESLRIQRWLDEEPDVLARAMRHPGEDDEHDERIWNPFDPKAWYYGRRSQKLNQSLTGLASYSLLFLLAFLVFNQIGGCRELYEMPAGGGEPKTIAQVVKVQKIIKKKFVVNPLGAILFQVPPIDEIRLQLTEVTSHLYKVGYGQGEGAGFAGGTQRGEVRFIRLEYSGGDWNQDFGVGADLNMLIEYGVRTNHKVAKKTESRTIHQLRNFPAGKSPPMVYLTGQRSIVLSKNEVQILREYLLEKHGMIFGDNGGSQHFHNQFLAMMDRVLPKVRPVPVALDDVIHRVPYQIPFLPYVAPHGGAVALGWNVDGRWVGYYHPGDIADAWTDDHAGVPPEIYEYCYQLGTNVIFYAHAEYNKWLDARRENR